MATRELTENQNQLEQDIMPENTIISRHQRPLTTNNNKKSFCIEALLAKNHVSDEEAAQQSQQQQQQQQQTLQEKMSHQKYMAIIQHHQQLSGVSHLGYESRPSFLQMKDMQGNPLMDNLKSQSPFKIVSEEFEHENYEKQIASNTIERYDREPSPNSGARSPRSPSSNRSPSPEEASEDHRSTGSYSPPISPGMEIERQEYGDQRTGI